MGLERAIKTTLMAPEVFKTPFNVGLSLELEVLPVFSSDYKKDYKCDLIRANYAGRVVFYRITSGVDLFDIVTCVCSPR